MDWRSAKRRTARYPFWYRDAAGAALRLCDGDTLAGSPEPVSEYCHYIACDTCDRLPKGKGTGRQSRHPELVEGWSEDRRALFNR